MEESIFDEKNMMVMKLLHYFITEKDYNPIILQGVENEIWLENLKEEYQVVRIVSGYIHNNEQFDFDKFKTKRIVKKIKRKTFTLFNMNVASFFLNLGDNVELEGQNKNTLWIKVKDEETFENNESIEKAFPGLNKNIKFEEEGTALFMKITSDINKHNQEDAKKIEKVFKNKFPFITYSLIALNIIIFIVPYLFGQNDEFVTQFCVHGPTIRYGEYYRLLTGAFLHSGLAHLGFNMYALYAIGGQIETFLGRAKFLVIYFVSILFASLMSMTFNGNTPSVGASGAIFGLMGAMLYFGYHYRVYLGNVLKSQIIPIIAINIIFGFIAQNVDNAAHLGGLVGGFLITMALGVKNKSSWFEETNGWIITVMLLLFTVYMAFVYAA